VTIDNELAIPGLNSSLEAAVDGVILEHVDHIFQVDKGVINSHNRDTIVEERIAQNDTADTTETVDSDFDDHGDYL